MVSKSTTIYTLQSLRIGSEQQCWEKEFLHPHTISCSLAGINQFFNIQSLCFLLHILKQATHFVLISLFLSQLFFPFLSLLSIMFITLIPTLKFPFSLLPSVNSLPLTGSLQAFSSAELLPCYYPKLNCVPQVQKKAQAGSVHIARVFLCFTTFAVLSSALSFLPPS